MNPERSIPEVIFSNEFDEAMKVVEGLYNLPRTGYVDRGVENPETVGEHSESLVAMVDIYAGILEEEGVDVRKLKRMLQIHDWAEYIVGDIVTAGLSAEDKIIAKAEKFEKEKAAMTDICSKLGDEGEINLALWLEFEEKNTREAQVGGQLDKLQAIEKAWEYEQAGQPCDAMGFVTYDEVNIIHPVLAARVREIKTEILASR